MALLRSNPEQPSHDHRSLIEYYLMSRILTAANSGMGGLA